MRSRPIAPSDRDAVVELLSKGFGFRRSRRFWRHVLDRLGKRAVPDGLPQYGYLLESAGRPVGAVLLIFSLPRGGQDGGGLRSNISSWYVEPSYRSYAPMLALQALRHKNATYLNISPAPNTWPILDAQGYKRYSNGTFLAVPALHGAASGGMRIVSGDREPDAPAEPFERDLVTRHLGYGCQSFWCVTPERAYPFVFRRLFVKAMPCAQLIYCRDVGDVARFAGPLGRHLFAHLCPLVTIDANGPLPGLAGHYFEGWKPRYFKGPQPPRLGDLADTEAALFGI
jgi:hypothetical protein